MSDYPLWWDTTVTIYNKFQDPQTKIVTWYKTVLRGAFWKYVGETVNIGKTTLATNDIVCRIREDARFLPKYEWVKIPNDKMSDYFTLAKGDIIVKGKIDDDISEYESGKRATDLVAKYKELQGCMVVEEFAIDIGAGRCNPHYRVRGV